MFLKTKVLLFGASKLGEKFYRCIPDNYEAVAFVDNDINKSGKELAGLPIISLVNISATSFEKIIITSSYKQEIKQQLIKQELTNQIDELDVTDFLRKRKVHQVDIGIAESYEFSGSLMYSLSIYYKIRNLIDEVFSTTKKLDRYVHLGCGQFILPDILLAASGRVKELYLVEPYHQIFDFEHSLSILKELRLAFNFQDVELNDLYIKKTSELEYIVNNSIVKIIKEPCKLDAVIPANSVEFMFSNAVLEHVDDVDGLFIQTKVVLKKGAYAWHQVDLRDHRPNTDSLDFLQYSDDEWLNINRLEAEYVNRLRVPDYIKSIERAELTVNSFDINLRYPACVNDLHLNERFSQNNQDDIDALSVAILLTKT